MKKETVFTQGERASSSKRAVNESELRHLYGAEEKPDTSDTKQDLVYRTFTNRRSNALLETVSASAAARKDDPSDEEFTFPAGANTLHRTSTDIRKRERS